MCGIAGSINIPFAFEELSAIGHRGPDAFDIQTINLNEDVITLGHVRLAIQDLSDNGSQPMETPRGNWVVFNGEIYNHLALRESLLPNFQFQGHSDTETLGALLDQYGLTIVPKLNGIFAFAYCLPASKTVHFVRDRFGVKPFYYARHGAGIVFASEVRFIQKIIRTSLSLPNIETPLRMRFSPSPNTIYDKIKKVAPGQIVSVDVSGDACSMSSSSIPLRTHRPKAINYKAAIESAVTRQLLADVEVGVFLSGGIDSAVVSKIAQDALPYSMKAYTVGFSESGLSEIEYAAKTAEYLGLDFHPITINFDDFIGAFTECVRIVEEPLATDSMIPMYYLAKKASKDVKVVLTGQGADEPLAGYRRYQIELLLSRIPRRLRSTVAPLIGNPRLQQIVSPQSIIERYPAYHQVFSVEELKALLKRPCINDLVQYVNINVEPNQEDFESLIRLDLGNNLPDDLLLYTDKITMNFGLECRVPMLDNELVNYILELPRNKRFSLQNTKKIHREYARAFLPQEIINRKKLGFESPTNSWFEKHSDQIVAMIEDDDGPFADLFDINKVISLVRDHQNNPLSRKKIFLLLSYLVLFKEHKLSIT